MAKGLAQGQAVWYVVSACIGGAIAGLGTYLAEKGKNRATKEDIAAITTKVKEVEDVFNRGLADLNAHHQLRMVAAERRLQAHQEAFTKWRGLYLSACSGDPELIRNSAIECTEWFDANCVFLNTESRSVFTSAKRAAYGIAAYSSKPELSTGDELKACWHIVEEAGNQILASVELPGMSIQEIREAGGKDAEISPV